MDNKEKNTQMFMYLAGSFEMSAMMTMGKLKNPMTDKTERDLVQAQFSIDILDMLKAKTHGNLSEYESKYLDNLLGQLKLNYLDEMKKDTEKPKDKTEIESDKPADENAGENKQDTK
jgi:hypothetical protein